MDDIPAKSKICKTRYEQVIESDSVFTNNARFLVEI